MSPEMTTIKLPIGVVERWEEFLEHLHEVCDEEDEEVSEEIRDPKLIQQLRDAKVTYLKNAARLELPYYGPKHRLTVVTEYALDIAIEDSYSLRGTITHDRWVALSKDLARWVQTGVFNPPRKRSAPKARSASVEQQALIKERVDAYVQQAMALLTRPESPVQVSARYAELAKVKYSFSASRVYSNGGFKSQRPALSFSLHQYIEESLNPDGPHTYHEYAQLAKSTSIGTCHGTWEVSLATLVAHEVAHTAQRAVTTKAPSTLVKAFAGIRQHYMKPHGEGWQEIYHYLRSNWINKMPSYRTGPAGH